MNLVEHLKKNKYLINAEVDKIYNDNSNYYLNLKKLTSIKNLYDEAIKYYGYESFKNSLNLSVNLEKTEAIYDFFEMTEKGCFCVKDKEKEFFLISNPDDVKTIEKIKELFPNISFAMADDEEYNAFFNRYINPLAISLRAKKISDEKSESKNQDTQTLLSDAQLLYKTLMDAAIENRASDLHIVPLKTVAEISFRVDGKIQKYTKIPNSVLENIKNLLVNVAKESPKNPNLPIKGKAVYDYNGTNIDMRINIIPSKLGSDINIRFLSSDIKTIDEIGFLDEEKKKFLKILSLTKGLVIITGPTGSGKTTSLYAGLNAIKNSGKKIVTMEDPVEITMEGITQVDIRADFSFGFTEGVATALRHDTDIGLIGETRIIDVANELIKLADTGHLAITTLHTIDSLGAISRLINLGVAPYALADILACVIAQRLVRRICPNCAETYILKKEHYWRTLFNLGDDEIKLTRGKGCTHCNGRGYYGRIAIVEFLISSKVLNEAIQNTANRFKLMEILKNQGFKTMLDDGITKAKLGLTSLEELESLANDIL